MLHAKHTLGSYLSSISESLPGIVLKVNLGLQILRVGLESNLLTLTFSHERDYAEERRRAQLYDS